jgi:hypothetical protein
VNSDSAPLLWYYDTIKRLAFQVKYRENMAFSALKSRFFEKFGAEDLPLSGVVDILKPKLAKGLP